MNTDIEHGMDKQQNSNRTLWLVIAIPALTVLGCLLTMYLAISSPDEVVSDYRIRTDTGIESRP